MPCPFVVGLESGFDLNPKKNLLLVKSCCGKLTKFARSTVAASVIFSIKNADSRILLIVWGVCKGNYHPKE